MGLPFEIYLQSLNLVSTESHSVKEINDTTQCEENLESIIVFIK
mgnify:CR=1 FL=1